MLCQKSVRDRFATIKESLDEREKEVGFWIVSGRPVCRQIRCAGDSTREADGGREHVSTTI